MYKHGVSKKLTICLMELLYACSNSSNLCIAIHV